MLTKRLEKFIKEELLEKRQYSDRPPRNEYVLTDAGRDYLPVLFMMGIWGRKHRGKGKLLRFIDADTGGDIKPIVIDAVTGVEIGVEKGARPIRMVLPKK